MSRRGRGATICAGKRRVSESLGNGFGEGCFHFDGGQGSGLTLLQPTSAHQQSRTPRARRTYCLVGSKVLPNLVTSPPESTAQAYMTPARL